MELHPSKVKLLSVLGDAWRGALRAAETTPDPQSHQLVTRLAKCLADERTRLSDPATSDYPSDNDFDLEVGSSTNQAELVRLVNALLEVQDKTPIRLAESSVALAVVLTQKFLRVLKDYRGSQK